MKKIVLLFTFLLTTLQMIGQIDRSKMPEPTKSPEINLSEPVVYKLDNGLTLFVIENHKFPTISLSLSMDKPPVFEGNKSGIFNITSDLMGKETKNISKEAFTEEVDFLGIDLNIDVDGGYVNALTRYFPRALELFADAALNPNFTQQELDKVVAKALQGLQAGENSTRAVANRVNNALIYTKNHPYGNFETETSYKSISLNDVKDFYLNNFSPNNAYIVVVGDILPNVAKDLVEKHFLKWVPSKTLQESIYTPKDVQYTQINFVDMPNATQSELNMFNLQELQMRDEDYFPCLIMNFILGGDFSSYINLNLREEHGYTYGAHSSINVNKWTPSTFRVSTKVRNEVTADAVLQIIKEIQRIQNQEVTSEKLAEAKANYLGGFILATEEPSTIARFTLNIEKNKLPKDFYRNYIKNIQAVTIEDVKRVANKYLKMNNLRFVIVGKKQDIAPALEQLKHNGKPLPVFYYDKFAEKVN